MTFALDSVKTNYGQLEIKSTGDHENTLFFGEKILFIREGGYLDIQNVYHINNSEIALMSHDAGGSGTTPTYFFVNLMPDSVLVSEEFEPWNAKINPVQKDDKIIVDLGYDNKLLEILTYQDGKQSIQKVKVKGKKRPKDEHDCNYLYNSIYIEYVKSQRCNDAPEEVYGMSTVRDYVSITQSPYINAEEFQNISKVSCKKNNSIKYSEFKKKVCAG